VAGVAPLGRVVLPSVSADAADADARNPLMARTIVTRR
jgi:hypothetical protein